ncbi:MAG: 30S ribosomal protein S9 [Alphaproteobacteria bacterium]|nr:30S ribosomal protein S9 [Alphaproteobacteria bacterium]
MSDGLNLEKHLQVAPEIKTIAADAVEPPVEQENAPVYERCVDDLGRSSATGKRKDAVVRVWLSSGKGEFVINGKDYTEYFKRKTHQIVLNSPFVCIDRISKYNIKATATGGGSTGQAEALRIGISRALVAFDPSCRPLLKAAGYLRRDSRIVERKKYGQKKARKRFQFSKR